MTHFTLEKILTENDEIESVLDLEGFNPKNKLQIVVDKLKFLTGSRATANVRPDLIRDINEILNMRYIDYEDLEYLQRLIDSRAFEAKVSDQVYAFFSNSIENLIELLHLM